MLSESIQASINFQSDSCMRCTGKRLAGCNFPPQVNQGNQDYLVLRALDLQAAMGILGSWVQMDYVGYQVPLGLMVSASLDGKENRVKMAALEGQVRCTQLISYLSTCTSAAV